MRTNWPQHTTAELIKSGALEIGDGYRAKNSEMSAEGLPFIRAGDVNGRVNTIGTDILSRESVQKAGPKVSLPGDVVITTKGTVGRVAIVRPDDPMFVYSPQLCYWRSKDVERIDPSWLFYALQSEEFLHQMQWSAGQTDMAPYMSLTDQRTFFKLTVPPLQEQRTISATLGALDDKIELNRKMNATLEAMARALFRDWFVDFGPTHGKMEGREAYLSPDLWAQFPDRLDDEGKPEGWEMRPLVDRFDLLMGQSPPGDTYNDTCDGLPFFQGRTDFGFRFPENRKYCSAPTRVAEKSDTLVSVRAPVGDINLASERCCIGRGVAAIRHKGGGSSFTYYTGWSLQEELRQYENTGTVFGAINKKQFETLPTVDPGPAVIQAFEEIVSALDSRIENNERESRTLAQTRDLLLPRLMSGELRVADAQRIAEEAH